MADKNHLKIADQVDLADDDPFAELTRIMGFDPRQPARQAPPAAGPAPAPHQAAADEDDFSLDLEKELLGSFDLDEEHAAPVADQTVEPPVETHEFEAAPEMHEPGAPETDFDFSAAFDEAMAVSDEPTHAVASEDETVFDGDFDRAFAAAASKDRSNGIGEDDGFDLGLTDEDIRGLDAAPPLPVTPEAVAADSEIDADLDAAMADFLEQAPPAETDDASFEASALEVAAAPAQEVGDFDHGLFDEGDFRIEDEATDEPVPAVEFEPATQPEIDESAFHFDDLLGSEENEPAGEEVAAAAEPAVELSFDGIDFGGDEPAGHDLVDNGGTPAAEEPVEEAPMMTEASPDSTPEPASGFEFAVPPFVPRKLPTSPMDVAAEEFRQREAAAPAEPEFNLEDELNALLGNARTSQASIETDAPAAAAADEPSMPETPAYESASASEAYQPFASNVFGSAVAQSGGGRDHGAPEPVAFEAPEHPADIPDDLDWDLGDALAETSAEFPEEHAQETYAQPDEVGEYAEDGQFDAYAEPERAEDAYAQAFEAEEEPAPIELDDDFAGDLDDERSPEPSDRDALAGIGIGAAAGYGASYAQRSFQAMAAAPGAASFSPHRDPVVRGNPLKEDPLDVITQLAEKYSRKEPATPYGRAMSIASGASSVAYEPEEEQSGEYLDISDAFEEPEVETVEVADEAVALADDLDIPELPEEEDLPPASGYDDLDAEFSSLLTEMNAEPQGGQQADGYGDPLAGGFSARHYENNVAATPHGARAAPAATYDGPEAEPYALDSYDLPGSHVPAGAQYAADDYEFDPDFDQEIAAEHLAGEDRKPKSRGLLLAGLIGGVALLGGVGAFALSFGGGDEAPAIVKADDGPVKVRPADPGGVTVPNQESQVYETVAGGNPAAAPQQETLVTTAEEPMDVMPPAIDDGQDVTASGKSEDRIEQIVQEAANQTDDQIVAVAPRKVRTLVVKPDGTLVPREDEPEAAAGERTDAIAAATPEAAPAAPIPESTGALPAGTADGVPSPALAPPPEEAQAAVAAPPAPQELTDEPEGQSEVTAAMPETVPIAPLRPADQPIDVVGEVKPDQVAAATTAAAGGWAMQIASQPSEAAAQSSYENLARRYGNVLQGREVNIVKAEIPGKGTFWRVRVPAQSRNEAITLCESYKSAGGNCFVSR